MSKGMGIESDLVTGYVQVSQELLSTFDNYSSEEWVAYAEQWPLHLLYNIHEVLSFLKTSEFTLVQAQNFIKSVAESCTIESVRENMLGLLYLNKELLFLFHAAIINYFATDFEANKSQLQTL